MWFVCVITGTVATSVVILSLWEKFQTNPTITGLDTDNHNWQVPFPAITLCPEKPASLEDIRNILGITENNSSTGNEEISLIYDLTQLSIHSVREFVTKHSEKLSGWKKIKDIRTEMFKFMDNCTDILKSCIFKGNKIPCCDIFFPVFTENGFCYSFNSRHYFRKSENAELNMQYIRKTDIKWSLEFSVNSQEVLTPIYIVNSDEMISYDVQPQHIWDYKIMKISFSIKQTYTTEDTRQLSIKQRRCIFEDEIKLEVDHMYTYTACAIQCRMDNAKSLCGCVPYFYPNIVDFPYCTVDKLDCIAKNIKRIKEIHGCDCQLGCTNTIYEVEAQNTIEDGVTDTMEVEFVSWPMARYKREVLFGWVDLLVSFGGIAGLFLGFSLLSVVEIFYYFIIRASIAAFRERDDLDRFDKESNTKPKPPYDLSMVPYFISAPVPGQGIDEIAKRYIVKRFGYQFGKKGNKVKPQRYPNSTEKWAMSKTIIPPFGIEFVN